MDSRLRDLGLPGLGIRPFKGHRMHGAQGGMPYLGGQGDLVSRLIMGINGVTIWVIGVINLLTKSP